MSKCPITNEELNESNSKTVFTESGNEILVHESVETKTCTVCGKEHVILDENNMYLIYDDSMNLICHSCQKEHKYIICSYCGEWEKKAQTKKVGRYNVCKPCLEQKFTVCADCGKFIAKDEARLTHNGTYICNSCAINYTACASCGHLLTQEQVNRTADNYSYCSDCFSTNTRICADCGEVYSQHMGGSTATSINGETVWYCQDCKEKHIDIHSYSYKPHGGFRTTNKDEQNTQEFFGAEIEIGNCSDANRYARSFLDLVNGDKAEQNVYLKQDSSIVGGGFECVTKPMTRSYIYDEFLPKLRSGLSFLDEHNFKGHNHGGIHIHVSKNAFNDRQVARIIPLLFTSNEDELSFWLTLTQRQKDNLLRWGAISETNLSTGDKATMSAQILSGARNWKNGIMDTRGAMNIVSSANTIEFRIFNSSTIPERIMERFEVIFSLKDFADTEIEVSHANYIKYIEHNKDKYTFLYDYLVEKEVINENTKTATVLGQTVSLEVA